MTNDELVEKLRSSFINSGTIWGTTIDNEEMYKKLMDFAVGYVRMSEMLDAVRAVVGYNVIYDLWGNATDKLIALHEANDE